MSTSQPSSIGSQLAISTLLKSKSCSSSSNISSLYEIEYVPGDQLPETTHPLVNPYKYFAKKPSTFSVKGVRELIKPSSNQKVSHGRKTIHIFDIPENLSRLWQHQSYSHLHFSVVRISLTLHVRSTSHNVNSFSRLSIEVVPTSLHWNGSNNIKCRNNIHNTFSKLQCFATRSKSLKELKVQLQLVGAPMQEKSVVATLHHQIV